jgi:hypothetical protein
MWYLSLQLFLLLLSDCNGYAGWNSIRKDITFLQQKRTLNPAFQLFSTTPDPSWDFDEDDIHEEDDEEELVKSTPSLGINIGSQLNPLSSEDVEILRKEATEKINEAFADRLEELANVKEEVRKDFERSKEELKIASDRRAKEETAKLMSKIDKISSDFLDKNEELRSGTKMAAMADKNMVGKGLEVGSWGRISSMNVLTSVSGGMSVGVLGSVDAVTKDLDSMDDETSNPSDKRILCILDGNQDKNLLPVVKRFEEIINETFPKPIKFDVLSPTSNIPMGGMNAQCVIISSTSLSGQSSAETILGRLLKRTIAPGGGMVSKPPSHIVIISPLGTARREAFPYSMHNMMGGGQLKKAREVEEVAISTVKGRFISDASIPALDYTIVKLGQIVEDEKMSDKDGTFNIQPGDCLDGKVGINAAANVLVQAVTMRPTARNATMSVVGAIGTKEIIEDETWEDLFICLEGPELWRSSDIYVDPDDFEQTFEELSVYLKEWSSRFENGAKGTGLTTPVTVSLSTFRGDVDSTFVRRKFGVMLQFKQTNTGSRYKSKSEEKELEKQSNSGGKNVAPPIQSSKQKKEGGVEVIVEEVVTGSDSNAIRVRARRCNMDDNTIVKEMSEETILKNLEDAIKVWNKR